MKPANIEQALRKSPFRPFYLLMDNGRAVRVAHPDCILFSGSKSTCVIAEGREGLLVLDVDHLSALSYEVRRKNGNSTKPSERRRRGGR